MRRLRLENRTNVLVLGDGPIGLLSVMLLRRLGVAEIVLAGGRARRLELGKSLGASQTLNYHQAGDNLAIGILRAHGGPFAQVIEASGSSRAMAAAIQVTAREGKVLVLGDYGAGRADFAWGDLLHMEMELIGSNASAGAWPRAVDLAVNGGLPLGRLISHRMPARDYMRGYELTKGKEDGVVKVVLEW
jgi:L-iditol 2-dehydrogenase